MSAALKEAAERACSRIAPTWPLDRFIAVNPFWASTHRPLPEVAGDLAALSGARLLMPRQWYAEEWRAGRFDVEHLREAIAESGLDVTEDDLLASFWIREPTATRRPLVVDVMETLRRRDHEQSWREFVMERISGFCASYFDDGQAQVNSVRDRGVYASWRHQAQTDHRPALFMELAGYRATVAALPASADEMIVHGCTDLGVPPEERERYLSALLLDVNGWASWCAYLRWTARLAGGDDDHIRELLAIRLAWEWILFRSSDEAVRAEWRFAMTSWAAIDRTAQLARAEDWILQRAVEIALLSQLRPKLPQGFAAARPAAPTLQAAFCLDVRSEVFRRALEAQGEGIQTLGVAGFFGVPIEYLPLAADDTRPQLPGLLAPKYRVTDTGVPPGLEATRRARLEAANAWKAFKSSSLSSERSSTRWACSSRAACTMTRSVPSRAPITIAPGSTPAITNNACLASRAASTERPSRSRSAARSPSRSCARWDSRATSRRSSCSSGTAARAKTTRMPRASTAAPAAASPATSTRARRPHC
jgi:hypothetical protein